MATEAMPGKENEGLTAQVGHWYGMIARRLLACAKPKGTVPATSAQPGTVQQREALPEQLKRCQAQLTRLQTEIAAARWGGPDSADASLQAQEQIGHLARLYVAVSMLHGTLDRQKVLVTVREILTDLVGAQSFGVFELDAGAGLLSPISAVGLDPERYSTIPLDTGPIARAALRGEKFTASRGRPTRRSADAHAPLACIPLLIENGVYGVVAIFRLLPHKGGFGPRDEELLDLLAVHGGRALYAASLVAGHSSTFSTPPPGASHEELAGRAGPPATAGGISTEEWPPTRPLRPEDLAAQALRHGGAPARPPAPRLFREIGE